MANSRVVSRDPVTGTEVYVCQALDAAEVAAAVARAVAIAPLWAATELTVRSAVLSRFADLLDAGKAELTELIVAEVGKRYEDARGEVEWTALSARWYAEHPPVDETVDGVAVQRVPLGVIAVITPWNVPLVTPAWKWLPALMAGNTVLWKPSELASAIAARATELLGAAGLPDDVLQFVPGGADTAVALCADARVVGVHFTGSTQTGRAINALVAPRFARVALEMGGINHAIVFPDADLDQAAEAIVASATALAGQKCTAVRRVLVHSQVAAVLVDRLVEQIEALVPGAPSDPATTLGPLITRSACQRAEEAVRSAQQQGARIAARSPTLSSAGTSSSAGSFFAATLLVGVADTDSLAVEEVFAPILTLAEFTDSEDVWERAGASGYGLSAAVYTRDPDVAAAAQQRVSVGVLALNRRSDAVGLEAPFGGRGLSGNGFPEGGMYAYGAVTDTVAVYGLDTLGPKASL
ncbi:MAG: aldehyde dehydrogenase family protein [Actinomycetota bacterium]|nr:aldehyde dehydrogenase family protein [Actinomycetota bacterium]